MPLSDAARAELDALGLKTKGPLGVALVVVARASTEPFPLDTSRFLTPRGGQVKGAGGPAVARILKKHGIVRRLAAEAGRTSRGSIMAMEALVGLLNRWAAEGHLDLEAVEAYWVDRVRDYFASTPISFRMDPAFGFTATVRGLMEQAAARQRESNGTMVVGTVMQHLVGAALEMAMPGVPVTHHPSNQNDASGRGGDFDIGDAVLHVTGSPSEALLAKCRDNLERGWRPVIITTRNGIVTAEVLAEAAGIAGRVDMIDFEQFIATNAQLRGHFGSGDSRSAMLGLIDRYNLIVGKVETDPSLRIVVD
ncbi:DUF4928 family protein [Phenylobacterium sp.]|uniref:DUF4928 family protein n=1 Tax=Phenylobacterium sp. TaxID=1871053 RepID=UPI0035AD965B